MDFTPELDRQLLERTPRVVRAMLEGLSPRWTDSNYGDATWSPTQILAHLIETEAINWIPRLEWIIEHGTSRPFEPYDPRAEDAPARTLENLPLPELLDRFDTDRAASLTTLDALLPQTGLLAEQALHPALGTVTAGQLLCTWVVHDQHHTAQIAKALAHQHRDEVGPWNAYLSILRTPSQS